MILDGKITSGPFFMPYPSSIDFELKAGSGTHQVVSVDADIVNNRDSLKGRVRVYGKLTGKDGDSVILAQRVEFL